MSDPTDFNTTPSDDNEHDIVIEGIPLSQVVSNRGPFLTCYLRSGDDLRARMETEVAKRPEISDGLGTVARTLCPDRLDEGAFCLVANAPGPGVGFRMADPIKRDVFRVGTVPSLGSLVESASLVPSHAVVTVGEGTYSLTSFGSSTVPSSERSTSSQYETEAEVVTALGFLRPAKIIVVGDPDQSDPLVVDLAMAYPSSLVAQAPATGGEASTEWIADMVVSSAASLRAELTTLELGRFRAARDEGVAVEEFDVLGAIATGTVSSVLVHDDPDDTRMVGADRLVDLVTAGALRKRIPLTLIPKVPEERGPKGGVGAILDGEAMKKSLAHILPEAARALAPQPGADVARVSPAG